MVLLANVEDKERKHSKARLFDHISNTSLETTTFDISGELMNFIDTVPFCSRFAKGFIEMVSQHLSEMGSIVCY